jgi:hypothetical protein
VGLGIGTVAGVVSLSKIGDVKGRCVDNQCLPSDRGEVNDAKTMGDISTAAFAVGSVLGAVGVVLMVFRPGEAAPEPSNGSEQSGQQRSPWALRLGLGHADVVVRF